MNKQDVRHGEGSYNVCTSLTTCRQQHVQEHVEGGHVVKRHKVTKVRNESEGILQRKSLEWRRTKLYYKGDESKKGISGSKLEYLRRRSDLKGRTLGMHTEWEQERGRTYQVGTGSELVELCQNQVLAQCV